MTSTQKPLQTNLIGRPCQLPLLVEGSWIKVTGEIVAVYLDGEQVVAQVLVKDEKAGAKRNSIVALPTSWLENIGDQPKREEDPRLNQEPRPPRSQMGQ